MNANYMRCSAALDIRKGNLKLQGNVKEWHKFSVETMGRPPEHP